MCSGVRSCHVQVTTLNLCCLALWNSCSVNLLQLLLLLLAAGDAAAAPAIHALRRALQDARRVQSGNYRRLLDGSNWPTCRRPTARQSPRHIWQGDACSSCWCRQSAWWQCARARWRAFWARYERCDRQHPREVLPVWRHSQYREQDGEHWAAWKGAGERFTSEICKVVARLGSPLF
jgi:hypothetical protein